MDRRGGRLRQGLRVLRRAVGHRTPPIRRRVVAPYFRPLRPILMPGSWLEETELLVVDLVELTEKLDHHAVGILVINGDVVADDVADRSPGEPDVVFCRSKSGVVSVE